MSLWILLPLIRKSIIIIKVLFLRSIIKFLKKEKRKREVLLRY